MKKKRTEHKFRSFLGKFLPYVAVFLVILGIAKVGSDNKDLSGASNINVNVIMAADYVVTSDQMSELYIVANLSDSFNLASVDTVASNYVMLSVMKEISQTTTDKIEKPSLVNTSLSRGVLTYTVGEGETMAGIAAKHGLTTDQVRWSNGLKTTAVTVGQVLKLPAVAGIVYTAKSGDTPDTLASKYSSSAEQIIAYNDLEGGALAEGAQILLPGGILPVTERPEYVAPVYNYTYSGSTSMRQSYRIVTNEYNLSAMYGNGNPGAPGQCTWFAWWWRATDPRSLGRLPGGLSHARYWATTGSVLSMYRVDHTPEVGAVLQTTEGSWYGHVAVVTSINADGTITIREMNYLNRAFTVFESIIPASNVGRYNYIH